MGEENEMRMLDELPEYWSCGVEVSRGLGQVDRKLDDLDTDPSLQQHSQSVNEN